MPAGGLPARGILISRREGGTGAKTPCRLPTRLQLTSFFNPTLPYNSMSILIVLIVSLWLICGFGNVLIGLTQIVAGVVGIIACVTVGIIGSILCGIAKILAKLGL
jgi:hypothetical protein